MLGYQEDFGVKISVFHIKELKVLLVDGCMGLLLSQNKSLWPLIASENDCLRLGEAGSISKVHAAKKK